MIVGKLSLRGLRRRRFAAMAALPWVAGVYAHAAEATAPERRFYAAALAMRELALSWGDQPYGAVLVQDARIVGDGPSRVVRNADPNAHAEREAIRDAQRRLGRQNLSGSVLYSTSRPCRACEAAAAVAGVARMVVGPDLVDAGAPRP